MANGRTILSPKLIRQQYGDDGAFHEHWCPGCNMTHQVAIERPFSNGAQWTWDGNALAPTFNPSVNVMPGGPRQCHYFVRAGRIEFCGDSHHALAGQTVDLPDLPAEELV